MSSRFSVHAPVDKSINACDLRMCTLRNATAEFVCFPSFSFKGILSLTDYCGEQVIEHYKKIDGLMTILLL